MHCCVLVSSYHLSQLLNQTDVENNLQNITDNSQNNIGSNERLKIQSFNKIKLNWHRG